jgi:hypothetical protein
MQFRAKYKNLKKGRIRSRIRTGSGKKKFRIQYVKSTRVLQPVDVRQIQDKFPEKSGGLKELYEKGPQDAFFLVKFWADLNTNISDESSAFYGVTTTYVL